MNIVTPRTEPQTGTLTDRVHRDLKSRLGRKEFGDARRMPSVAQLAAHYGVSVITVRSALQRLETEKLISRRNRSGAFPLTETATIAQRTIAVLSPDQPNEEQLRRSPLGWSSGSMLGILGEIRDGGLHALALNPGLIDEKLVNQLARDRVFGAVIPEGASVTEIVAWSTMLREHGIAAVTLGGDPALDSFDSVRSDHDAGSYALTRWLIDRGRRKIARFYAAGGKNQHWLEQRRNGFARALGETGIEPVPAVVWSPVRADPGTRDGFDTLVRLAAGYLGPVLSDGSIDAIMVASDGDVPFVAAACRLFGKEPNKDVWIVGYDNYWSEIVERKFEKTGPLASIDKDNPAQGREMVRLLRNRVDGKLGEDPCHVTVPARLVELVQEPS